MGKAEITTRTLWGVAKSPELRLTDEELHIIVEQQTGKTSIKALNKKEMGRVVAYLYRLKDSAKRDRKEKRLPSSGNEATANQRRKIYRMMDEAGWGNPRLRGLCKRMFGLEAVEWLNYRQCSDLIEAMKAIIGRERGTDDSGREDAETV